MNQLKLVRKKGGVKMKSESLVSMIRAPYSQRKAIWAYDTVNRAVITVTRYGEEEIVDVNSSSVGYYRDILMGGNPMWALVGVRTTTTGDMVVMFRSILDENLTVTFEFAVSASAP